MSVPSIDIAEIIGDDPRVVDVNLALRLVMATLGGLRGSVEAVPMTNPPFAATGASTPYENRVSAELHGNRWMRVAFDVPALVGVRMMEPYCGSLAPTADGQSH